MSTPPIKMEDEVSVLSEQIPTPTPPPQLTKVKLTCSLWFENPFTSPPAGSPLSLASKENHYIIANAAHPLRMELEEGEMTFGAFTNAIIIEIGSAAPAAYHLRQVLREAANSRHIQWRYRITQHDGSQSWTAEAQSGDKHKAFLQAAHTFPLGSQFEVDVKMDRPEEEIIILQGFQPSAITIVPEVVMLQAAPQPTTDPLATPHEPALPQAIVHQPMDNQPATHQAVTNPPAENHAVTNPPADNQAVAHHPANTQAAEVHPAINPAPDLTLEEFFTICKINFHDCQIQALLKKNLIFHWSTFKGLGIRRLENLGFNLASPLIITGTLEAIRLTEPA
ncbi:hypothetical protein PCASD_06816 [Puccinia coronata f. sp. avenae]|uniref:Uncharacterized protein n=1 Tax=Puccinia coronata f. sp. avenae TaxID=200324 RepID=A0A2N5UQB6_9BASI|nr:hypothetical protein PCASD_06816 [Puccinia coronata f. sp. avenae]